MTATWKAIQIFYKIVFSCGIVLTVEVIEVVVIFVIVDVVVVEIVVFDVVVVVVD